MASLLARWFIHSQTSQEGQSLQLETDKPEGQSVDVLFVIYPVRQARKASLNSSEQTSQMASQWAPNSDNSETSQKGQSIQAKSQDKLERPVDSSWQATRYSASQTSQKLRLRFLRRNYDAITNQRKTGGHSHSKKLQVRER
jgi:hypothetical protein